MLTVGCDGKVMPVTKTAIRPVRIEGARDVLRQNLQNLMRVHPTLKSRKAIQGRTDVSERTIGYMLQQEGPSPTLSNLEAVAGAYKLEVWEILMPGLDVSKVATHLSPKEAALHKKIEQSMAELGITEYKLPKSRGQ
jgi:hypothetical protein